MYLVILPKGCSRNYPQEGVDGKLFYVLGVVGCEKLHVQGMGVQNTPRTNAGYSILSGGSGVLAKIMSWGWRGLKNVAVHPLLRIISGTALMQRQVSNIKQTSLGSRDADRQYSNQDGKSEEQQ